MKWYVLYTRHYHERAVYERLLNKGFQAYLPWTTVWRRAKKGKRQAAIPLFPRYVFVRCYLEMYAHLELISLPGVMRLVEDSQAAGELLVIPEDQMRLLRQLSDAGLALERVDYQTEGEYVEVVHGPLRGLTGILRPEPRVMLLVPLQALQICIAVEMSRTQVTPCIRGGRGAFSTLPS